MVPQLGEGDGTGGVDGVQRGGQGFRGRGSRFGELDRRAEHVVEGQRSVRVVEGDPAVDAARNGDAAHVVAERHRRVALGAQRVGRIVGAAARPAAGIERMDGAAVVH
ncbi:MAG TPA: hypothetical protein VK631_09235, partial [Solirubrobacteraceae bacterium]|nr:hypothetical protein [Solirubrobacteraceae bacterium]